MEMAYNGSQRSVDVPSAGLFGVERGAPVDVADSHTRKMLHLQGWDYVHENDKTNDEKDGDDS
jgi:hypothetical protein